ncbi:hypothetical protein ACWCXH_34085 [Kitasatospora sp. NPDC001660]
MTTASPAYCDGDVLEETKPPGRLLKVLAVGEESYFVRVLGDAPGAAEPREWAWAYRGCEQGTRLIRPAGDGPSADDA